MRPPDYAIRASYQARRRRAATEPASAGGLSGARRRSSDRPQAVQSFALDLAASLLAYAEPLADLLMSLGTIITETVPADDDLSVARREKAQHRGNLVPALVRDCTLERVLRSRVGH